MKRFLLPLLVTLVAVGAVASPAAAQGRGNGNGGSSGPVLLSDTRYDWLEGDDAWVTVSWTTETTITDVKMTVAASDSAIGISYPTNTPGYTGLANGSELSEFEVDHTSFYVESSSFDGNKFDLDLTLSYVADGVEQSSTHTIAYKTVPYTGSEYYEFTTTNLEITAGAAPATGWVEFNFVGLHPNLSRVQLDVDSDLSIIYPQGTYSSLHYDARLRNGERDVIRVWIDPDQLTSGDQHELTINTRYRSGNGPKQGTHTVILDVG